MRILIAGASGAIGRALVRRLRASQHEVFALTQSRDSAPALNEMGAEPVVGNALDAAAVKAAVGRIRPDAVINVREVTRARLIANLVCGPNLASSWGLGAGVGKLSVSLRDARFQH
jgi:nucleoside-diphosphate-sugar epimerase